MYQVESAYLTPVLLQKKQVASPHSSASFVRHRINWETQPKAAARAAADLPHVRDQWVNPFALAPQQGTKKQNKQKPGHPNKLVLKQQAEGCCRGRRRRRC
jgi:hypothetical protein